jgi:hypothetical protein
MRATYEAPSRQVAPNNFKIWQPLFDGTNADVSRLMMVPDDLTRRYVPLP